MGNYNHEEYKERLDYLKNLIETTNSEEIDYLMDSVYRVYEMLIANEQYLDFDTDKPIFCKRLLRIYKYIPSYILDENRVDRVVISGLYALVDVCLIPKKLFDQATGGKDLGEVKNPEKYGLPSDNEVNYGTRKVITPNLVLAICNDSWANNEINYTTQYDYVLLES